MHTSRSWPGTISSSGSPFSAWSEAIVMISSASASAIAPSESPGSACTTQSGSYTSSSGTVVVVLVDEVLLDEELLGAVDGAVVSVGVGVRSVRPSTWGPGRSRRAAGSIAAASLHAAARRQPPISQTIRGARTGDTLQSSHRASTAISRVFIFS